MNSPFVQEQARRLAASADDRETRASDPAAAARPRPGPPALSAGPGPIAEQPASWRLGAAFLRRQGPSADVAARPWRSSPRC